MGLEAMLKEYGETRGRMQTLLSTAEKDKRELTDGEKGQLAVDLEKATGLGEQIKAARENAQLLDQIKDLPEFTGHAPDSDAGKKDGDGDGKKDGDKDGGDKVQKPQYMSAGDRFIQSEQVKALHKAYPNGVGDRHQIDLPPVELAVGIKSLVSGQKTLVQVGDNATVEGSTLPGAIQPDFRGILPPYFQPLGVMDVITIGQTTGEVVSFVRELVSGRDNNADVVPEATQTALSGDEASVKPESGFQFEPKTASVVTIATWVPVTNRALSDIGQLRTLIDAFLTRYIEETLIDQVLHGGGAGTELDGVLNDEGLTQTAFVTDLFTSIRKAITAVRPFGTPNGILMSPADVETVDLAQDDVKRYYGNGPFGMGPRTLWGLPIVEAPGMDEGVALLGDLKQIVYYDREATNITVGTVNEQFIRNMRTLLAETRGALAVQRPAAITAVPLSASSS